MSPAYKPRTKYKTFCLQNLNHGLYSIIDRTLVLNYRKSVKDTVAISLAYEPNFTINNSDYWVPIEIAEICALLEHEAKSTAGELQFLPSLQIKRLIHKEADLQTSKRKLTSA